MILSFKGRTLTQILETHDAAFTVSDPYRRYYVSLGGISVPLAANFTSGYGLWLARSGFATQALRNAIGTSDGLAEPHIYLLQPRPRSAHHRHAARPGQQPRGLDQHGQRSAGR